jgi:pimeloyl-ACP methyl ester carboxylesterase
MALFVLVPGAWLGGWCWRDVAAALRAAGHSVVGATLTGLGERAHLLSPETGLHTHVADIAGLLRYHDFRDVVLVGHSYGGTVVTAVAEQTAERIAQLVYLDASVPLDGQSNDDVIGPEMAARLQATARAEGEGWRVPPAEYVTATMPEGLRDWVRERLTPHPLRAFAQPVQLRSAAAAALPRAFIRTTHSPLYDGLLARARTGGWPCREVPGGHYAMLTEPAAVAAALGDVASVVQAR